MDNGPQETFTVFFNGTQQVVAIGTLDRCSIHPRDVFRDAIKNNAKSIIIAHNHPSGNTRPSKQDFDITKSLVEAGKIIGIPIQDHVIVGDNNQYFSIKEHFDEIFQPK